MRVNSVDNAKQLTCVRVSAVFLICLACKVYITEENVGVQAVVSTRTHNFVCTGWTRERERERIQKTTSIRFWACIIRILFLNFSTLSKAVSHLNINKWAREG